MAQALKRTASAPYANPNRQNDALASPLSDLGSEPSQYVVVAMNDSISPSSHDIKTGEWSTGLFNCFDFCVPNCCMVTLCPCGSVAQIASRLGFTYQIVLFAFGVLIAIEYFLHCYIAAKLFRYYVDYLPDTRPTYRYVRVYNTMTDLQYPAYMIGLVVSIAIWMLRNEVRERFKIPGSCFGDFCVTFFCSCCALAQMATHVKSYKPHHCKFGAPDELPAYDE